MRSTRGRLAAAVAVFVATLLPAPGQARSPEDGAVTLGAVNTFTASTTAGLRVRIPNPATFEPGVASRDIRVSGSGRMAGYVLVEDDDDVERRVTLMTTWSRFCGRPGCGEDDPFFWHGGTNVGYDPDTKVRTLPPGDYFLYVIADGTPVTVTLRLDGLSGRRRGELTDPVDAGIASPSPRAVVEPSKTTYWFGEEVEFSGPTGIAIPLIRFEMGRAVLNRREACYYHDGPKAPEQVAYGPGCPRADLGMAVQETGYQDGGVVVDGYYSQVTGKTGWGFGMNYLVAGEVRRADSLFFYLDVDPAEL